MDARITAIEARRGTRARRVLLDGEPWRMLPADLVGAMELFVDELVDVSVLELRVAEVEGSFAYRRALALLSRRDYSITSLTERLRRDGYSLEAVEACVTRLGETGLLDDMRYAEALLRSLRRRGLGRRRLRQELSRRGLPPDLATDEPEHAESDRVLDVARKLARVGQAPERLAAKLVRRGFAPTQGMAAAKTALSELNDADSTPPTLR